MSTCSYRRFRSFAGACLLVCLLVWPLHAATITIINMDRPNEGLNDPTPMAPVGGNAGTTLGQQRLLAAQFAASIWGDLLLSNIEIRVGLTFDPLGGSATGAVLAGAGPTTFFRNFPGTPRADTWYASALADALANVDLNPAINDIISIANSSIDTNNALGTTRFYYGFDRNNGRDVDFIATFLHELGHGLGFASLIDDNTGAKALGCDDAYSLHLIHRGTVPEDFPSMTNRQRLAAITGGPNLRWNGPNVKSASGRLAVGASSAGDVEIYAPNPLQPGSSVSHFSTSLAPNELMEPFITGPIHDVGLTLELFQDLGWTTNEPQGMACDMAPGGDVILGQPACEEDVPDNNAITARSGWIGDIYFFTASAGTQIDLRVDTTDANLDPVLLLVAPNGDVIASGNDEVPCAGARWTKGGSHKKRDKSRNRA